jgi:hypothetical protein
MCPNYLSDAELRAGSPRAYTGHRRHRARKNSRVASGPRPYALSQKARRRFLASRASSEPRSRKRRVGTAGVAELRATPDSFEQIYGIPLVGFYGLLATRYMHETGITREQLAAVPVTMRADD